MNISVPLLIDVGLNLISNGFLLARPHLSASSVAALICSIYQKTLRFLKAGNLGVVS